MLEINLKACLSRNIKAGEINIEDFKLFVAQRASRTISAVFAALYDCSDGHIDTYPLEECFGSEYWDRASSMLSGFTQEDYELSYLFKESEPVTDQVAGDVFLCKKISALRKKIDDPVKMYEMDIFELLILMQTLDYWAETYDSFGSYMEAAGDRNADRDIVRYMLRTKYHLVPAKARVLSDSLIFAEKISYLGKTKQSVLFDDDPLAFFIPSFCGQLIHISRRFGSCSLDNISSGICSLTLPARYKYDYEDNDSCISNFADYAYEMDEYESPARVHTAI